MISREKIICEWDATEGVWLLMWPTGTVASFSTADRALSAITKHAKLVAKKHSVISVIEWRNVPAGFTEPKVRS